MKEDFYNIKNIIAMKKIILILSILLVSAAGMDAQVRSTYFQTNNAFQAYPALESVSTAFPVKQMPVVNVNSLLAEDRELAGPDMNVFPHTARNGVRVRLMLSE
jgi:hypothetical protein